LIVLLKANEEKIAGFIQYRQFHFPLMA